MQTITNNYNKGVVLKKLSEASFKVGLNMSIKNTKIMQNKDAKDENNNIEVVDLYINPGQCIFMDFTSKNKKSNAEYM